MLKSTNKLQIKQCKELITYSSRGTQHRTQGSIKKYNFEHIHTFEQLRARSSAKVSLHNTIGLVKACGFIPAWSISLRCPKPELGIQHS